MNSGTTLVSAPNEETSMPFAPSRMVSESIRYVRGTIRRLLRPNGPQTDVRLSSPRPQSLGFEYAGSGPLPRGFSRPGDRTGDVVYAPVLDSLDELQLDNVRLAFLCRDVDFVIVSDGLAEAPSLSAASLRDHVVFRREHASVFQDSAKPTRPLRGLQLRLPRERGTPSTTLSELLTIPATTTAPGMLTLGSGRGGETAFFDPRPWATTLNPVSSAKPCVLILPAVFALGGVERNAVAVMKELRDRYSFVVVLTERADPSKGSLQRQLVGLADAVYDFAEIAGNGHHLALLETIKLAYRPSVVWICNGSPWLCDNAPQIRELFHDTPITDQEAYDTQAGWVSRYLEPGIQSYDRFIAVSRKIQKHFIENLRIDPARVDLIDSAVETSRFVRKEWTAEEADRILAEFRLPKAAERYAFIGRLTGQKRPFDFLDLAWHAQQDGLDCSFVLLGDGELSEPIDEAIKSLKLTNISRIRYTDRLSDLHPLFDGLIITSAFEGLPIAMLEALCCGTPVLSTDVGDIRYVLERHDCGMTIPEIGNTDALYAAWLEWRKRRADFRASALRQAPRVREEFGTEAAGRLYHACWTKAIACRQPRPVRSAA